MKKILWMLLGCMAALGAHAEIYKHVDADGHVTYSNVPMKGAVKLNIDSSPPSGGNGGAGKSTKNAPSPADFPKVDKAEQKQRDDKRREILEEELANERKALEEAKKAYAEGEANPEVSKGKNGKVYRNVAKYEEKMQKLQEDVSLHEKNVGLLEKELGSLK